ncbi:MAG TPA: hypothetical protein VLJ42_13730 [Solirubrobacteraceae bacterium]|nr:hypothetical protein [Solirubrobacteraceae bacterium]
MDPIHPITPRPSPIPPAGPLRPERVTRERDRARERERNRGSDPERRPPKQPNPEVVRPVPPENDGDGEPSRHIDVRA